MKLKKAKNLFWLLILVSCTPDTNEINSNNDFYLDLIDISVGPSSYSSVSGRFNRLLFNNHDGRLNLIVERILTDDEGLNKKLDKRIVINNLNFGKEVVYDISLKKWIDTDNLLVQIENQCHKIEILQNDVKIVKMESCN